MWKSKLSWKKKPKFPIFKQKWKNWRQALLRKTLSLPHYKPLWRKMTVRVFYWMYYGCRVHGFYSRYMYVYTVPIFLDGQGLEMKLMHVVHAWLCYCCAHKILEGQWKHSGTVWLHMVMPCCFRTSFYCTYMDMHLIQQKSTYTTGS